MQFVDDIFARSIVLRLGFTLLHFLWQGVFVVAITSAILFCLRRATPSWRYGVMLGLFGVMALCPVITFCIATTPVPFVQPIRQTTNLNAIPVHPIEHQETVESRLMNSSVAQTGAAKVQESREIRSAQTKPNVQDWIQRNLRMLVMFWAIGVCFFSLRLILGWGHVLRVRSCGQPRS